MSGAEALQALLALADNGTSLSAEERLALTEELLTRGIPPITGSVQDAIVPYPRSADLNGYDVLTGSRPVRLEGPFGPVVALYVDASDTTSDVFLLGEGLSGPQAIRVRGGQKRRLEFYTPTDGSGVRLQRLTFVLWSSATQTGKKIIVEVE